jgi:hypothetical protein
MRDRPGPVQISRTDQSNRFIIAECIQKSSPVLQKLKANPEFPEKIPDFSREADLA